MPTGQSGFGIHSNNRTGVCLHGIAAMGTKVIRCGITRGQIHQTQFVVGSCKAPNIRCAAGIRLALRGQLGIAFAADVPGPSKFAGLWIVCPDNARWFFNFLVVHHPATDH